MRDSGVANNARPRRRRAAPKRNAAVFGPIGGPALQPQVRRAHSKVRQAENRAGSDPRLRRYPKLASYTPKQRAAIVQGQGARVRQIQRANPGTSVVANLYGSPQNREQLHKLEGATKTSGKHADQAIARAAIGHDLTPFPQTPKNLAAFGKRIRESGQGPDDSAISARTTARNTAPHHGLGLGKKGAHLVAGVPLLGAVAKVGGKALDNTTGGILNELARPLHAVAGASYEAGQHPGSVSAILKGASEGIQNKTHHTFSDVLASHGASKGFQLIGGLGMDIIGDPLSYASAGASAPSKVLEEGARVASETADAVRAAGNLAKATRYEDRAAKLLDRAATAPTNRGIQLGARLPGARGTVKTTGTGSANLSKLLGIPKAADHLREGESLPARTVQALGHALSPGFRPRGVDKAEWEVYQQARHLRSATQRTGIDRTEREATGISKLLGGEQGSHAIVRDVAENAPEDVEAAKLIRESVMSKAGQKAVPSVVAAKAAIRDTVEKARTALKDAQKEERAAERANTKAIEDFGVAHGRAAVLSRNVADRAGETAAERATYLAKLAKSKEGRSGSASDVLRWMDRVDAHGASFAGGGRGAHDATDTLHAAAERLDVARVARADAEGKLAAVKREAKKAERGLKKNRKNMARQHANDLINDLPKVQEADLGPKESKVLEFLRGANARMAHDEHLHGVLPNTRENYLYHVTPQDAEPGRRAGRLGTSDAKHSPAKRRRIDGSISEINHGAEHPLFEENVAAIHAARGSKHFRTIAAKKEQDMLILGGAAKPMTKDTLDALPATHSLYHMDGEGVRPIETRLGHPDFKAARAAIKNDEPVYAMNRAIGESLNRTGFLAKRNPHHEDIMRGYDRMMGKLKTVLTVLNFPAFDLRNLTGDTFNAYLADTHASDFTAAAKAMGIRVKGQRAIARLDEHAHDGTISVRGRQVRIKDLIHEWEQNGAASGYQRGEKFELAHNADDGAMANVHTRSLALRPVDALRHVGAYREDFVRLATFIGARRRGMSAAKAAEWTNRHHFDYADLTDFERGVMRRIFPFYTFAARNTKLQATKLLTNPGKYANYEAIREEGAKQSGLGPGWESHLAPYQQRGGAIPIRLHGANRLLFPALPLTDLGRLGALGSPKDEYDMTMANLTPPVKSLIEYLGNHSFFFRGPIYADKDNPDAREMVAAPPFLASIPGVKEALGLKQLPDPKTGKKVWMYSAKADYFARQLPQSNFAIQSLTPSQGSHGVTGGEQIASQLSGVKIGNYDRTAVELTNAYDHAAETRLLINHLKGPDGSGARRKDDPTAYTPEYRKALDDLSRTTKRIAKLKLKRGDQKPLPRAKRKSKRKGTAAYGTPAGGSTYGSGGSAKMYGAP